MLGVPSRGELLFASHIPFDKFRSCETTQGVIGHYAPAFAGAVICALGTLLILY